MKILKSILAGIFWLLIIALMVAPLAMIYQISQDEMKQYETPAPPKLVETAMGGIVMAQQQDVQEYVTVSGIFTSTAYAFQELDYKTPSTTRWLVGIGDEVQEGQVIGIHNGQEVLAAETGVLVEMNSYSSDAYLRYRLFAPVELECQVSKRILSVLQRAESFLTEDGETVTLTYVSNRKNMDGTTNIRLSIDSDRYSYGEAMDALNILTGTVYRRTTVLPVDCVYQKEAGENHPWYVRQVTKDGVFIAELEVEVGYSNGDMICVGGVEVGTYYDSGYKAVIGG